MDDVSTLVRLGFALDASTHIRGISDPDEQRDAVQEVFVRALSEKARMSYDGLRPYRPYLLRIAKNLMIDRARKIKRRPTKAEPRSGVLDVDDLIDRDAPMPEPEEDMDWRNQRRVAIRYMETLPGDLRELVQLRFVDCRSQASVAEALGITRRRVRTLEKRCLAGLVTLLEKEKLL
jgi:RNA polymerase sigma-70 factor (ECF subfamily)